MEFERKIPVHDGHTAFEYYKFCINNNGITYYTKEEVEPNVTQKALLWCDRANRWSNEGWGRPVAILRILRETEYKGIFECSLYWYDWGTKTYYIGLNLERLRSDEEYIQYLFKMIKKRLLEIDEYGKAYIDRTLEKASLSETGFYLGTIVKIQDGWGYELDPEVCEFAKKQPEYIEYKTAKEEKNKIIREKRAKIEIEQSYEKTLERIKKLFEERKSRREQISELREQMAQYEQQIAQETNAEKLEDLKWEVYELKKKLKPLEEDESLLLQITQLFGLNQQSLDDNEHTEGKSPKM